MHRGKLSLTRETGFIIDWNPKLFVGIMMANIRSQLIGQGSGDASMALS